MLTASVAAGAAACSHGRPTTDAVASRSGHVVIDGAFHDWPASAYVAHRAGAAPATGFASNADIVGVAQQADAHYVYLRLDLTQAANLYGLHGTVSLEFDADNNASTGAEVDGLAGTDFAVDLSPTINGRVTEGADVRTMRDGRVASTADTYGLDFVLLPTIATNTAELRIARGRRPDSTSAPVFLGNAYRAQVVVRDSAGTVRYRLPSFSAQLASMDTVTRVATSDPLARAPNTQIRVLQWNVANEGIRDRAEHYRRVIAAIDPDVLILDEVGGVVGNDGTGKFLATITSKRGNAPWSYTYGGGGGYQRTVIATRTSVSEFPEFKFIPFADSMTNRLLAAVPAATREKQRANLAEGVATGGAIVSLNGKRIAVFGVDLQSAGNSPTSWQELRRLAETNVIRDLARQVIRTHGPVDAVIAAGDHNLVSTRQPLTTMGEIGLAFDNKPLSVAELLQLDSATAATWDGSGEQFPPGRLDWISYSGSSLQVLGGFVFDVADLGERWRVAHGLEADDSKHSSDHRPVVVDLRWR
ncbi:MAG TPA: endonuclease/exonuclease/phosphatase family protein [Gemmatimonadaceae bacterium]|jgi:ketosteroid isomerase-like protein